MEEIDIFKKKAKKEYSKNNSNFKKNDVINISVVDTDNKVIDKLKDVIDKSNYNLKGIFSKGEEFIDFCKNNDIALVFIGLELDGSLNGVETAVNLEYMDIPVIFIADEENDLISSALKNAPYGLLFKGCGKSEIRFAVESAINKHDFNLKIIQNTENRLKEKNTELVIEKLDSSLILFCSIILILAGIISQNITFLQWIIFIPAVLMLIQSLISLKKQKEVIPYEIPPFVSIIIPAHNEEYSIAETVRSVANMDYSLNGKPNFEILVVNDGSTDNTGKILSNLKNEIENIRIITRRPPKSGKGKGFVLNDALNLAHGDIIGVFDADTQVESDFLSVIVNYLNSPEVVGVQSRVRMYNRDENFLANMQDVEFAGFGNVLRAKDNHGFNGFLGGNGQFVKKEAIIGSGKWDGFAVTEDLNLSIKILLNGDGIRYCPDAVVYQEAITKWKPFMRQRSRWAIGNFETLFIYIGRILTSKLSAIKKISIIEHISFYTFNLFIFIGFIIFLVNVVAWLFSNPTVIRMEAPLWVGVLSAFAFFPGIFVSLLRDDKKYVTFIKDLIGYWVYCFHLIPLFFYVMYLMITRKQRKWEKTEHKGRD